MVSVTFSGAFWLQPARLARDRIKANPNATIFFILYLLSLYHLSQSHFFEYMVLVLTPSIAPSFPERALIASIGPSTATLIIEIFLGA